MILRPATIADRDAVVALALHFHASTPYGSLVTVDPLRIGYLFDLALASGVVFVAESGLPDDPDGEPVPASAVVAFLGLTVLELAVSGDRYAEELAWWVEPAYRSGTLGPRLLRMAEDWAVAQGCAFVKMGAPEGQPAVGRWYQRQGYQAVETAFMKRVA